jgi:DNA-binding response OmpR family regulator
MIKILCVDDDPGIRRLYSEELTEEGYQVFEAGNGKKAVAEFPRIQPDLVILDIQMPQLDGIHTLSDLLGKNRRIPVILNTAYPQYKENFMTWGAEPFVVKSSDLGELKEKIHRLLAERGE